MSEQNETQENAITFEELAPVLQAVAKYENVPAEMYGMLASVYEVSEEGIRGVWDELPASARNVLEDFSQFHALVSVSQCYAGIDFLAEFEKADLSDMNEEQKQDYKAHLLDKLLHQCAKDLAKQLKQARLKPNLKREFLAVFEG